MRTAIREFLFHCESLLSIVQKINVEKRIIEIIVHLDAFCLSNIILHDTCVLFDAIFFSLLFLKVSKVSNVTTSQSNDRLIYIVITKIAKI